MFGAVEVILHRNVVTADVEDRGGVQGVDDISGNVQRVHDAAVDVLVDDRPVRRVVLIDQVGAEAAEPPEHSQLLVDHPVGAAADIVVGVGSRVISTEVVHAGDVVARASAETSLTWPLSRSDNSSIQSAVIAAAAARRPVREFRRELLIDIDPQTRLVVGVHVAALDLRRPWEHLANGV